MLISFHCGVNLVLWNGLSNFCWIYQIIYSTGRTADDMQTDHEHPAITR